MFDIEKTKILRMTWKRPKRFMYNPNFCLLKSKILVYISRRFVPTGKHVFVEQLFRTLKLNWSYWIYVWNQHLTHQNEASCQIIELMLMLAVTVLYWDLKSFILFCSILAKCGCRTTSYCTCSRATGVCS